MGVEFLACKNCGDTFPDCGNFVGCECGEHWCSERCAEADGYQYEEEGFKPEGQEWEQDTSCNFCKGEDASDWELLNFALKLLNMDRKELVKQLKK